MLETVGEYEVSGRNQSGRLLEMCAEQEFVVGNSLFTKNNIYKYKWVTMVEGMVSDRALMHYVLLPKQMRRRLLDVHVRTGEGGGMSDYFLVEARLQVVSGQRNDNRMEGVGNVFKVNELNKSVN